MALISGSADVDAVTVSLSRLSHAGVAQTTGLRVALPLIVATIAGLAVLAPR